MPTRAVVTPHVPSPPLWAAGVLFFTVVVTALPILDFTCAPTVYRAPLCLVPCTQPPLWGLPCWTVSAPFIFVAARRCVAGWTPGLSPPVGRGRVLL